MRRFLPPMNSLMAFEVAARHGNFTRAARELNIAQPAVTRHVAKLENWLGEPLFIRSGNALELTSGGNDLSDLATQVLGRLEHGIQDIIRSSRNEIVIGASFGVTHLWLMPRMRGLTSAAGAAINFVTSDDYRSFDQQGVDVSIRFGNGNFAGHRAELLLAEHCQLIVSPAFLDAHPAFDPTNPANSVNPSLLLDHGDRFETGWIDFAHFCANTGNPMPPGVRVRTLQSYPLILDMVARGEGVGVGSHGLEDSLVDSGEIVRVGPSLGRKGFGYYLVYRADLAGSPALESLRRHLLNPAQD